MCRRGQGTPGPPITAGLQSPPRTRRKLAGALAHGNSLARPQVSWHPVDGRLPSSLGNSSLQSPSPAPIPAGELLWAVGGTHSSPLGVSPKSALTAGQPGRRRPAGSLKLLKATPAHSLQKLFCCCNPKEKGIPLKKGNLHHSYSQVSRVCWSGGGAGWPAQWVELRQSV